MRLIDANEFKKRIDHYPAEIRDIAKKELRHVPTIEAEPIRHGKLMRTEAYPHRLYCSECFMTLIPNEEICFEKNEFPKYCMWCGAKMDEEEAK